MRIPMLCALALVAGMFGATGASAAQTYPVRAVRVIVPFPPGEAADIIARLVTPVLTQRMGQQFVVDNRPGAAGQIGLHLLKQATPDGYTIGMGQGGNMSVQPHTYAKLPYDALKDFSGLALAATNYLAVVANPNAPFKTPTEMIDWAKKNPAKLSVGTNGEGGYPHLTMEFLARSAGFTFLHVPYKGAGQITTEVLAGQIQTGVGSYTSLSPHVLAGKLRLIAVTNDVRVPNKPELPIFADTVPGYDMRGWFGFVALAGTPRDIVKRLNEEINRAMQLPEVNAKLVDLGLIVQNESAEYFDKFLKREYDKYGKLVRDIGLKPR
ncbi:MAG: tripartite tricarboxylate transporter substrate binding protein [Betaproteobacteria bacterium]|nr:tripartite tricarboxylate transporter substrate binding protein [Betaproteobacteria bacterium]